MISIPKRLRPDLTNRFRPPRETSDQLYLSFKKSLNDYGAESDRPGKSEDALIGIIRKMDYLKIASPNVFQELVDLKIFESMVDLLDNCGNNLASCIFLQFEMITQGDIRVMHDAQAAGLVDFLVKYHAVGKFVSCFFRFSEDDDVVYGALQTIAHMIFLRPDVAEIVGKQTNLINWVLDVIKTKGCGYKKQYTAGLLTTILQSTSKENIVELGKMGSVVVVVEALLPYTKCAVNKVGKLDQEILALFGKSLVKKEDVLDEDEIFDLVQSLFDCLFCLLSSVENKKRFADAGGVHLMLQIVKQEKLNNFYYGSAIAALDIALEHCPSASNKFVSDALALDIAFPASIDAISSSITHKGDEIEGHLMSLITTLTLNDGSTGVKKDTLLDKFEENDYKLIAWLLDLFTQYSLKVCAAANHLKQKQLDRSELYDEKLEYGLSTLQSIAVILAYLWSSERSILRAKIEEQKKAVLEILKEYRDNIGNEDESEEIVAKTVINEYIVSLEKQ
ncbi:beta-catenin-like protein 1 [Papaver somniferum]|uniref:beta-catenin-like protein 1 n=1 Tax=Papaver somniferum TaxID=3469 RepID=UPI000E6FA3D6|nr:beta-catenin-like protein 1 [Papaver somniferum]